MTDLLGLRFVILFLLLISLVVFLFTHFGRDETDKRRLHQRGAERRASASTTTRPT